MAIKISGSTIIDDSRGIVNAGISTFNNDVTFLGASYNATWDKSDNSLIFADNTKAKFGTGGDLEIFHNGSDGRLVSTDTIRVRTPLLNIQNNAGNENIALFYDDTDGVHLYNNNSVKFCTTTYGVCVAGSLCATTLYGDGSNLNNVGFDPDADQNLVAGDSAGANLDGSSACFNLLLGDDAGKQLTGGEQNIFLGKYAGKGNSSFTSTNNIAIGCGAMGLASSALGSTNIAIGEESLKGVTGIKNIAIGRGSGQSVSSGCYNSMFGMESGRCLTTGKFNLFLGHCSGYGANAITGDHNYVIGCHAGRCISSGGNNIFFGKNAASSGTVTGGSNIVIGNNTGKNISNGNYNNFFGYYAGCANTTGNCNVFIG